MNLTDVITGTPVTSEELRAARDRRILKKWELLSAGDGSCLVEFSLNIAGAVKVFPFARTAFREELRELQEKLGRFSIKNTKICSSASSAWSHPRQKNSRNHGIREALLSRNVKKSISECEPELFRSTSPGFGVVETS